MKCLDCGHTLVLNTKSKFKEWFCAHCSAKFVYVSFFDNKISEYSKNKLMSELTLAKVISQSECLICQTRMVKVLDFVKFNEVEACPRCKMIWLNAGEYAKIQGDQVQLSNKPLKAQMPSGFERPIDIQIGANDDYVSGSHSFGKFAAAIINNTFLGSISSSHPILGWFLAIILLMVLFFIFFYFFGFFKLFDFVRILNRS